MSGQIDDIKRYIRLTESIGHRDLNEAIEVVDPTIHDELVEDVQDVIFKLRSYVETEGSGDYVRGIEEGLALAAQLLERVVDKHSSAGDQL